MDAASIISELRQPWRHGEHFDGRDLVLDEQLVLDGLQIRSFDFSRASFFQAWRGSEIVESPGHVIFLVPFSETICALMVCTQAK
jgi:hypothetical protein